MERTPERSEHEGPTRTAADGGRREAFWTTQARDQGKRRTKVRWAGARPPARGSG